MVILQAEDSDMIGETLGHYTILEKLGAGGMGEVYRASDSKLGRDVAIKVIPALLAANEEILARFEREARALAAVDHPNIAAIYSFESARAADGDEDDFRSIRFLVMQLVEGETLDAVLSRGPISIRDALGMAKQIADALESAHGRGIIHRDLKPGNVKVDREGRVRVLDFGLAKFIEAAETAEGSQEHGRTPSHTQSSPTMKLSQLTPTSNVDVTREGALLGTAAYMSPEQARGKQADERSDIWAFGCVLYEMLTGKRPFGGATLSDCIAQIIEREPDLQKLPSSVPQSIRTLIRLCLTKDPKRRLHDMSDVRLWLERWTEIEPAEKRPVSIGRQVAPWVLAVVGVAAAIWAFMGQSPEAGMQGVTRFRLQTQKLALGPHPCSSIVALSPDGRTMAYVAGEGTKGQIYLRRLDSPEATPVAGAEMARLPFFSPDGRWLGYEVDDKLMRVPVEGGKAWPICDVTWAHGASWGRDGTIVVGTEEGIGIVPADGGELELIVEPAGDLGYRWMVWPEVLPDGRTVLYTIGDGTGGSVGIGMVDLESRETRNLLDEGGNPRYLASGHIAYPVDGSLMVVPFDLKKGELTGKPTVALDGILMGFPWDPPFAHYAVSTNGTLVYAAGPMIAVGNQLLQVSRDGSEVPVGEPARRIFGPRFSPDGRQIAMNATVGDVVAHLWIYDLERETFTHRTANRQVWWPQWTLDGEDLVFTSPIDESTGQYRLFRMPADGAAEPERIDRLEYGVQATGFSPDGRTLLVHRSEQPGTGWDVIALDLADPEREARPLLATSSDEQLAVLSPDGRWLAYASNESGHTEIYVRSYPDLATKWQVSTGGGSEPAWSPDGSELFYRDEEGLRLLAVDVALNPEFRPGKPVVVLEGAYVATVGFGRNYDIAPDGKSFLMVRQDLGGTENASLQVVLNWDEEVTALLANESR
jgi:serine/threonine-protein kinase